VLGPLNVVRAVSASDDVFFYTLGYRFWVQRDLDGPEAVQQVAHAYGLGVATGIDLPGEAAGRVDSPSGRTSLHARYPKAFPEGGWFAGDNVEMAFGQGGTVITPLQLAVAYATFANGGTRFQPRLAAAATDQAGRQPAGFPAKAAGHVSLPRRSATRCWRGSLARSSSRAGPPPPPLPGSRSTSSRSPARPGPRA
jgi:penicillin-binding protein 2